MYKSSTLGRTASSYKGCYSGSLSNITNSNITYSHPHWFAPTTPIDLRGYNYLFAYIIAGINDSHHTSTGGAPIFSIGDSPDTTPYNDSNLVISSDYFFGGNAYIGSSLTSSTEILLIVDISNCQSENKYFKFGVNAYSAWDDDDYDVIYSLEAEHSTNNSEYVGLAKTKDDIIYSTNSGSTVPTMNLTGKD